MIQGDPGVIQTANLAGISSNYLCLVSWMLEKTRSKARIIRWRKARPPSGRMGAPRWKDRLGDQEGSGGDGDGEA